MNGLPTRELRLTIRLAEFEYDTIESAAKHACLATATYARSVLQRVAREHLERARRRNKGEANVR